MDHIAASCLFMQVIDILCNDMNVKVLFQFSQSDMSCVRLGVEQFPASLVVEVEDQFWVGSKAFGGCYIFHPVFFPETVGVTKGRNATFGAHAGAGQYD